MKLLMISLGCDKNLVDSEEMLGRLREDNFDFTDDPADADVIVINTCAFISDAQEESINTILEMAEYKESAGNGGKCKALVITGCLAQRYADQIHEELPEVDAIVGSASYDKICEIIDDVIATESHDIISDLTELPKISHNRVVTTGGYTAFLKISEGCNKRCSYCIIPYIRGNYRSYPIEELVVEAKRLVNNGVKELIIVAQETTIYGIDLYGQKMLPKLLTELCKIDDLKWIRLMYCYPEEITDELIQTIKNEEKICNYLDIPIQHASDNILTRMGRKTREQEIRGLIDKLRNEIPDIALRTSLISGFPGETEEDFRILYNFVDEMEFDRLGVFTYSAEDGTPAAEMPDQVDEEVKEARKNEIMELQQAIAFEKAEQLIGKTVDAFIEGRIIGEDVYEARTYMDAPGVDGLIFINTYRELMSGDLVSVKITDAKEYDLIGELSDESSK